jgi:hypothetical protein
MAKEPRIGQRSTARVNIKGKLTVTSKDRANWGEWQFRQTLDRFIWLGQV